MEEDGRMNVLDTTGLGALYLSVWKTRRPARNDILEGTENDEQQSNPLGLCRTDQTCLYTATQTHMDSADLLDSLPYYDDDLQKFPILKEKVDHELAKEGKHPSELHSRVPPPIELFTVREQIT